jgi:hypothetical protein
MGLFLLIVVGAAWAKDTGMNQQVKGEKSAPAA